MRINTTFIVLALCAVGIMGCGTSAPRFRSEPRNTPVSRDIGSHQLSGIASYYAEEFNGRTTANGERYDMHALTAAHRTLPFSTMVRVTNNENGRSVIVRINDRGPFKDDRVIDLSLEAAQRIGLTGKGTGPVTLEIVSTSAAPNE
jgi:peptidoglycan lytic transglycosylase